MASDQTVQTAVYELEVGRFKVVLSWVVAVLVAAAVGMWYTSDQFRGLDKREAQDMAQLARNISRNEGFTTSVIRPLSLWHLKTYRPDHQWQFDNHPDLYNAPLYPLVLGGIFRLAGDKPFQAKPNDAIYTPERWLILPFNQICLLLTLALIFNWAQQLFDRRVAITAGLLLMFSDTLWSFGVSGLPTTFLMLLFLLAVFCLYHADRRLNPPDAADDAEPVAADAWSLTLVAVSALLMGLCFLTRYSSAVLMIPMMIYAGRVLRQRNAKMWTGMYVLIFALVITPWLIRNYIVSHSLLGLSRYEFFMTDTTLRSLEINFSNSWTLRGWFRDFLTRFRENWSGTFRSVGTDICLFFFVVGLLYEFRRSDTVRLRRLTVGLLAAGLVGMSLLGWTLDRVGTGVSGNNLLVLLLPVIVVYGVAFFYLLLDRIQFRMRLTQGLVVGVFAFVNVLPMILSLLPPGKSYYPYPPYCSPWTRVLSHWFTKDEVGVSDAPWSVAWYADRRCVWLPNTPEQFIEIHDIYTPHNTQFLFLTPYMLDTRNESDLTKGEYKPWFPIIHGQVMERFPFRAVTAVPPDNDQLLFAETARWTTKPSPVTVDINKKKKEGEAEKEKGSSTNAPTAGEGKGEAK